MPTYAARTDASHVPLYDVDPAEFGGKGAGLLEMAGNGLNVPEALILTTDVWRHYRETGTLHPLAENQIAQFLVDYPDALFSVRSGAPISMPGMMDTVLNVGAERNHPDYERFATGWLTIVKDISKERVKYLMDEIKKRSETFGTFKNVLLDRLLGHAAGVTIPSERIDQVTSCVTAVFESWNTPRAKAYRKMHDIDDNMGTACIVQRMVMGTADGLSGSGVMFTRDPATGENKITGEIGFNCQGEEIVSGEITPQNINELWDEGGEKHALYVKLRDLCGKLETRYKDVQDIEFTVESGTLYVLQTRTAKMSAKARIDTAVQFAKEEKIPLNYLKKRLTRRMVESSKVSFVSSKDEPCVVGLAASPSAFSGRIVWRDTPLGDIDKTCILVAEDTQPEDFPQMAAAGAILTKTGGFTCHSAVVARGIGVSAVVGADDLEFTHNDGVDFVKIGGNTMVRGETITIDGGTGGVWVGKMDISVGGDVTELYDILKAEFDKHGGDISDNVFFLKNSDAGTHRTYVLDLGNMADTEEKIIAAEKHKKADSKNHAAFEVDFTGHGEDLISNKVGVIHQGFIKYFRDSLAGHIVFGTEGNALTEFRSATGTLTPSKFTKSIDLLDLLDVT